MNLTCKVDNLSIPAIRREYFNKGDVIDLGLLPEGFPFKDKEFARLLRKKGWATVNKQTKSEEG